MVKRRRGRTSRFGRALCREPCNWLDRGEKWNSLAGQVSHMHYWRLVTLRCTHEELRLNPARLMSIRPTGGA